MPHTLEALRELGVRIEECDGYPFRGIRFLGSDFEIEAEFPSGHGIGVRRPLLHRKLLEQAYLENVRFRWRTPVSELLSDGVIAGGRVIKATWIVGADGMGSRMRKCAGLERNAVKKDFRYAFRRHHGIKPWSEFVEIYWSDRVQTTVTPVGSHEVCVVLLSRDSGIRSAAIPKLFPELAKRLEQAEWMSAERGAVTRTYGLNRVHSGRIALVGDASGTVDAITGEGLRLAFRQATALTEAMRAADLRLYQDAHRRLGARSALVSELLLLLAGNSALRKRTMRCLEASPALFTRLLAFHAGESSPMHFAATGALMAWEFATASI